MGVRGYGINEHPPGPFKKLLGVMVLFLIPALPFLLAPTQSMKALVLWLHAATFQTPPDWVLK